MRNRVLIRPKLEFDEEGRIVYNAHFASKPKVPGEFKQIPLEYASFADIEEWVHPDDFAAHINVRQYVKHRNEVAFAKKGY